MHVIISIFVIFGYVHCLDHPFGTGTLKPPLNEFELFNTSYVPLHLFTERQLWLTNIRTGLPKSTYKLNYASFGLHKIKSNVKLSFLPYDITEDCLDVYASTPFSGYCQLQDRCYAVTEIETDHTWYGYSVKICAGLPVEFRNPIVHYTIDLYDIDTNAVVAAFKKIGIRISEVIRNDVVIMYIHEFGYYNIVTNTILKLLNTPDYLSHFAPVGDWHLVHIRKPFYSHFKHLIFDVAIDRDVEDVNKLPVTPYIVKLSDHSLLGSCATLPDISYVNNQYVMQFNDPELSDDVLFPMNRTHGFKEYLWRTHGPAMRFCPTDYFPHPLSEAVNITFIVRTKTTGIISHYAGTFAEQASGIIAALFKKIIDFLHPFISALVKVCLQILVELIESFVKIIDEDAKDFNKLTTLIVSLISSIFNFTAKLIILLDSKFNFLEYTLFYILLFRFIKDHIITFIVLLFVFPFIPVVRIYPSLLSAFNTTAY